MLTIKLSNLLFLLNYIYKEYTMCKKKFRKDLYECARIYSKGLLPESQLKECLADYILEVVSKDIYSQVSKCVNNYESEMSYAK